MGKKVRYGMIGGDLQAFIGDVHRKAIAFDNLAELVAGCFSTNNEKNQKTGDFFGLDGARVYKSFQDMAEGEAAREDKIDFVCITTPNRTHYEAAKAFLLKDIHVVCEKPLCFTVAEAEELEKIAKERNLLFGVSYAYTGNVMVKYAKELIEKGEIGEVLTVSGQYLQEWLIDELGDSSDTAKLSIWRFDPEFAGASNCVGDIGSHIENTVHYMTGLHIKRVAAKLDTFGMALDLNANIMVEYDNGAFGSYFASQVAVGHTNDLGVRIYGTKGSIEWREEAPNELIYTKKGQAPQTLTRGNGYIGGYPAEVSRVPAGHPEGFYESFSNFYRTFITALSKKINGQALDKKDLDFPSVTEGLAGVRFINAAVESSKNDAKWISIS